MPTVPTYERQESWQIPSVDKTASAPTRLKEAYQNNLSRTGELLSLAQTYWFGKDKKDRSALPKQMDFKEKDSSGESFQNEVNMRADLLADVQKQVEEKGVLSVEKLDEYANRHFTPQTASGSVGRDYLVLRQTARKDTSFLERETKKKTVQTEAHLIGQIGALLPNEESLEEYLSSQLPAYEEHLRQTGETDDAVRYASQNLREKAVSQQIRRSLAGGDWQLAEKVFSAVKSSFSSQGQEELATKIRSSFAQHCANALWDSAKKEKNDTLEEKLLFCQKNITEKDPSLKKAVLAHIEGIFRKEKQAEKLSCASLYERLFRAVPEENFAILMGDDRILKGEELQQALLVAGDVFQPVTREDDKKFVKLYFHGSGADIFSAWRLHQLSTSEYWLLQCVRSRREAVGADRDAYFLCSGIRQFCSRQKHEISALWRMLKTVLAGGILPEDQLQTWEKIKKLLNH